jgi:hypothetical protein
MLIIFQLSRLLGLAVGALVCLGAFAWAGVVIGATLGISVGYLVGALLHEFALIGILLGMKWSDTMKLKARLERDYCLSHLIIAELVSRGEPVEQFRGLVEGLLRSDSAFRRSYGKMNRHKWFPDMKP